LYVVEQIESMLDHCPLQYFARWFQYELPRRRSMVVCAAVVVLAWKAGEYGF
jgi:hypothetical protein